MMTTIIMAMLATQAVVQLRRHVACDTTHTTQNTDHAPAVGIHPVHAVLADQGVQRLQMMQTEFA